MGIYEGQKNSIQGELKEDLALYLKQLDRIIQSVMEEKKNSKGEQSSKSKSSTASIEEPRKQKAKKKKEKEKEDDQMKFGRRMFDDDINTFFDYIQQAAGPERAFEGPCAIQLFSVAGEPRMGTPFFLGKKISYQVLLNKEIQHFVLISYDPIDKCVNIFDSLYKEGRKHIRHFPSTICYQICSTYGHLAEDGKLMVRLQTDYETQDDEWSCGYRCVGAVLAMYQELEPATISFDLRSIYEFFMKVIDKDQNKTRPSWDDIMSLNIGSDLEKEEVSYIPVTLMVNEPGYGLRETTKASTDEDIEDIAEDIKNALVDKNIRQKQLPQYLPLLTWCQKYNEVFEPERAEKSKKKDAIGSSIVF